MQRLRLFNLILLILLIATGGTISAQNTDQPSETISDKELEAFSEALTQVSALQQEINNKAQTIIEESEITSSEFNNIYSAYQNNDQQKLSQISEEKREDFEDVLNSINTVQRNYQDKMVKHIENADLTVAQYNDIVDAIQNDEALLRRFQEIHQK